MKSREEMILEVNELVNQLEIVKAQHNKLVKPVPIQHGALNSSPKKQNSALFTPASSEEIDALKKTLQITIEDLSKRIEALDIELYGRSDRTSPSFVCTRK